MTRGSCFQDHNTKSDLEISLIHGDAYNNLSMVTKLEGAPEEGKQFHLEGQESFKEEAPPL